jgi:hypothetical protein
MTKQREQSEWDMSFSFLARLNYWLHIADISSQELNLYDWTHSLINISRNLRGHIKNEEWKQRQSFLKNALVTSNQNINKIKKGRIDSELYWKLDEYQAELIKILKESGLLIKMEKSWDDSFGKI